MGIFSVLELDILPRIYIFFQLAFKDILYMFISQRQNLVFFFEHWKK